MPNTPSAQKKGPTRGGGLRPPPQRGAGAFGALWIPLWVLSFVRLGCSTSSEFIKIHQNQSKLIKINQNQSKSIEIQGYPWPTPDFPKPLGSRTYGFQDPRCLYALVPRFPDWYQCETIVRNIVRNIGQTSTWTA